VTEVLSVNFRQRYNLYRTVVLIVALSLAGIMVVGCQSRELPPKEEEMVLRISSPVFQEGDKIPTKYTCEGQDISPPLVWTDPPSGTQSFALIVDDPDAPGGTFTHWVLFNIPADSRKLSEAIPTQAHLPNGARQGRNDFRRNGYGGPCPPPGRPHRYQFTLYALDQPIDLEAGVAKKQLIDAMQGHILGKVQLTGAYQR